MCVDVWEGWLRHWGPYIALIPRYVLIFPSKFEVRGEGYNFWSLIYTTI